MSDNSKIVCYKKINLKCLDILKSYLIDNVPMSTDTELVQLPDDLLTIVNSELNSYGISDVSYCRYYRRFKNSTQFLHVDGHTGKILHCAINIPLSGGKNSKFEWHAGDFELVEVNVGVTKQKTYSVKWNSPSVPIESVEMIDGCYLVRIDQPHRAISSMDEDRVVFTIRFKGNPTFEELAKIFDSNVK